MILPSRVFVNGQIQSVVFEGCVGSFPEAVERVAVCPAIGSDKFYSYGYYETSMKAIKNDGVISSFFTYTGPSDNNPWDEIAQ